MMMDRMENGLARIMAWARLPLERILIALVMFFVVFMGKGRMGRIGNLLG